MNLYSLWRQTKSIAQHDEWLQFEDKANSIKAWVKYIYAIGLGASFILSTFTVNYYIKRAQESTSEEEADRKNKKVREQESSDDSDDALYEADFPNHKKLQKKSEGEDLKNDEQTATEKSMKSVDHIFEKVLMPAV